MIDLAELPGLFRLTLSPAEIIIRGTAMYWFLFALFRFVMRRDLGSIAIADILLLVLVADASQNAMAGSYESIADGCLLVATITGWNQLLDWSSYRFPAVRRLIEPKPLLLVKNGRILRANMRRELITVEELKSKLREEGVVHIGEVRAAYMENDGEISLVLDQDLHGKPDRAELEEASISAEDDPPAPKPDGPRKAIAPPRKRRRNAGAKRPAP